MAEVLEAFEHLDLGNPDSREEVLKEVVDLVYVLLGYCDLVGADFDTAFERVHNSNMSKLLGATFRPDGKLLKGSHYRPPSLRGLT